MSDGSPPRHWPLPTDNMRPGPSFAHDFMGPGFALSGGLSAASSRRPSYAAEFSSRPRLIDPEAGFALSPSADMPRPSVVMSNPTVGSMVSDTNRWLAAKPSAGSGSVWSTDLQESPTRADDLVMPMSSPPARNFRSISLSHGYGQPPLVSQHRVLGSFNEEGTPVDDSALIDEMDDSRPGYYDTEPQTQQPHNRQRSIHGAIGQVSLQPRGSSPPGAPGASSLWFGGTSSRRHSYAGEPHAEPVPQQSSAANRDASSPERRPEPASPIKQAPTIPSTTDEYFTMDRRGRNTLMESILAGDADAFAGSPPLQHADIASMVSVPSRKLYFVQFKAGRIDVFFIPETSSLVVKLNDLVIVDADRGRDLGKVVKDHVTLEEAGTLKYRRHQEQLAVLQHSPTLGGSGGAAASNTSSGSSAPGITMPKQILRYAQANEIQQIATKQADEEKALIMCMHKVKEKGLDMSVLDAEYQWDRRKLTFFYAASHRIDFRDLVRDLFRMYKTRIWMCAVNGASPSKAAGSPDAATAAPSMSPQTAARDHRSPKLTASHQVPEYGLATSQLFGSSDRRYGQQLSYDAPWNLPRPDMTFSMSQQHPTQPEYYAGGQLDAPGFRHHAAPPSTMPGPYWYAMPPPANSYY